MYLASEVDELLDGWLLVYRLFLLALTGGKRFAQVAQSIVGSAYDLLTLEN